MFLSSVENPDLLCDDAALEYVQSAGLIWFLGTMAGQAKESARFFSLKWKAGLLFSLILIGVNGGLAALGYLQLQHQFVQHQREINQQQAEELRALVLDRFQQLEQVAALTPVIAASQSGESRLAKRLEMVFEQNAATLEIDWGLDFAAFFSSSGEPLYHWQSEQTLAYFKPQVAQVNRTQQPFHWIDCQRGCRPVCGGAPCSTGRSMPA